MPASVLVVQSNPAEAKILVEHLEKRGDQVRLVSSLTQAAATLKTERPTLVFVDIHLPGREWLDLIELIKRAHPTARIIVTNQRPDLQRELLAKTQGVQVFLRAPFAARWIDKALEQAASGAVAASKGFIPRVRIPMRLKITFPYALLALVFATAAAVLVTRFVLESVQARFVNQLVDAGKLAADWMVSEEDRILSNLRLLANTAGVAEAVSAQDTQRLREIVLPFAVNYEEEAIEVLDQQGASLLAVHHIPNGAREDYTITQGDASLAGLDFVQKVLQQQADTRGDKFAGLVQAAWGNYFYIAGPLVDEQGRTVGALLIGVSLTTLNADIRQSTLAQVTIYDQLTGQPLASTLLLQNALQPLTATQTQAVLQDQDLQSNIRALQVGSAGYREILAPWEARGGADLGLLGVALAENFAMQPSLVTRFQILLVVLVGLLAIIAVGFLTANQITRPLSRIVQASTQVAQGNFEVKVPPAGDDEVAVLAHSFNYMISGLQEGSIYRDLLGRTVSPEVREALRASFAKGDLRLEGQSTVATVLMSDIRGFTPLSEKEDPTIILRWLNEYFGELAPVVALHNGVVDKFEGDALLAFFGILPTPRTPTESAYDACQAAVEMLAVIGKINARRAARGEPPLVTGLSINTGALTAGGLGTADRLNYTIIGDAVNTTQRLQDLTRDFGESGAVVSEYTLKALEGRRGQFRFDALGEHTFKGKEESLWVYRLWPADIGQ